MSEFPTLRTGAIAQYPSHKSTGYATHLLNFVDGGEQRFSAYCKPLRVWTIRLALLDEQETNLLTEFFRIKNGAAGAFSFTDPWTGEEYPNCSFCSDEMPVVFEGYANHNIVMVIRENAY